MSEKEEMLTELEFMYEARIEEIGAEYSTHAEKDREKISHLYFMSQEHTERIYQAIRSLIEKFFEWQEIADKTCKFYVEDGNRPKMLFGFIEEIRDFGKEERKGE